MTNKRLLTILESMDKDKTVEIADIFDAIEEENQILRRFLWLNHGCDHRYLYGDDGEMQCNKCILDFKRMDIKTIMRFIESKNFDKFLEMMREKYRVNNDKEH